MLRTWFCRITHRREISTLNTLIFQDTSSAAFQGGTRVYVLQKDGVYLLNAQLAFADKTLSFRAEYGNTTGHYDPTVYPVSGHDRKPPGRVRKSCRRKL